MKGLEVRRADYDSAVDQVALVSMLDQYARSAEGGGTGLSAAVKSELPSRLAAMPHALTGLAWLDGAAVGVVNGFETLSTFKARPILNIHDLAVTQTVRGSGVGHALLIWFEEQARARACCKITLEVLEGNSRALAVYHRFGFAQYALDPAFGHALFWEKPL